VTPGRCTLEVLLVLCWLLLLTGSPAHAQGLGEFVSPGKLAQPHADLEGITQCGECHELGKGVSAKLCMDCHDEIRREVQANDGFHKDKGQACQSCHPDHRGRDFALVQLTDKQRATFDHDQTRFPLRGAHRGAACEDCHEDTESWKGLSATCSSCHLDEDPHRKDESGHAYLAECARCHTMASWEALPLKVDAFRHTDPSLVDWVLRGAHTKVACEECHEDMVFVPQRFDTCTSCHSNAHRMKVGACTECHTEASWRVASFDHARTGFRLDGRHTQVACRECHGTRLLAPLEHDGCDSCHDDVHEGKFAPSPCASCHTTSDWNVVQDFDHARTAFALQGAHTNVDCEQCHVDGRWKGIPHETCLDCHNDDNPHDPTEIRADECLECHTIETWTDPTFSHVERTGFALDVLHDEAACLDCHRGHDHYAGLEHACRSCHEDDAPADHFPGACDECHQGVTWKNGSLGTLGHDITGFPLHGAHETLDCSDCHEVDLAYGAASPRCIDCHDEHDAHRHQLGDDCADCHTMASWLVTTFRHTQTGWPIRGAHRMAACQDCHALGYAGTPTDCRVCHETEAPLGVVAHQSAFFPMCETCHRTYSWVVPSGIGDRP
jgi:hypothetical protein